MRLLFWNLGQRATAKLVADAVRALDVDLLLLAESDFDQDLAALLNADSDRPFWFPEPLPGARLRLHTRLPEDAVEPIAEKNWLAAYQVKPPIGCDFLLISAHFGSKLHLDRAAQAALSPRLRESIDEWEMKVGNARTVVAGDFNMNPFEDGVIGSEGLHAVMTRADAQRNARQVLGQRRRFFYDPMWRHFGDRDGAPAGTYRDSGSGPVAFLWNIFDQVIIRPDLLKCFDDQSVKIVTKFQGRNLMTRSGRPNRKAGSDHFPILFELVPERAVLNG